MMSWVMLSGETVAVDVAGQPAASDAPRRARDLELFGFPAAAPAGRLRS
jgi:hypothetical protein